MDQSSGLATGDSTPTGKFEVPKEVDWDLWLGTAPHRDFNPTYLPAIWRGWVDFGTGSLGIWVVILLMCLSVL